MVSKIALYKELSIAMLEALKEECYDDFDLLLEERQSIINRFLENNELHYFEDLYNKHDIKSIDTEMRELLATQIQKTKLEIREYKVKVQGNSSYNNVKKENINIFSKKV